MRENCRISIVTASDGKESEFVSVGVFERVGRHRRVGYEIEGDEGSLLFTPRELMMKRSGAVDLHGRFSAGLTTTLSMRSGPFCGDLPVFTHFYNFEETDNGFFCDLTYDLFSDSKPVCFQLKISVIPEEK